MILEDALTQFIEDTGNMRSVETARTYKNGLAVFKTYLSDSNIPLSSDVNCMTAKLFIGYPSWISKKSYAPKTKTVYVAGVKQFMEWCLMQGCLVFDYAEQLRIGRSFKEISKKHEALMMRFPDADTVDKMRKAVRNKPFKQPKDRIIRLRDIAIIEFLASSGCRNFEAVNLLVGSIDLDERKAIVLGKGRKERFIYFDRATVTALKDYWILRGPVNPKDPAFARHDPGVSKKTKLQPVTMTTIRNIVAEVKEIAGVKEFSPHWFRHAFAIKTLKETGNLAMVQDFLGHADPKSTRVYAKIDDADRQKAHRAIFGN